MASIFDENSEFLKYVRDSQGEGEGTGEPPKPKIEEEHTELHIGAQVPYVLDLKQHKLSEPLADTETVEIKKEIPVEFESPRLKKLDSLPEKTTFASFVWDKFRFILTTGVIFLITFIAINWPAYSQVFHSWYLNFRGVELDTPLKIFSENKTTQTVSAAPFDYKGTEIPKLDIEVAPPGTRIIIPRIGLNIPVVSVSDDKLILRDWKALENDIQKALRNGVVHYPGTPYPDQSGNIVVTGHSSYYPWDPGRFKDVFAILNQVKDGDEIVVFYKQKKYLYIVSEIKIVLPTEVNVLGDAGDDRLTLITCTPIGTNLKRLVVTARPEKL